MSQNIKEMMDIEEAAFNMPNNENADLCGSCTEKCCENMGCEIFPIDVIKRYGEISVDAIERWIETGYVSLDWWEGDPRNDMDELDKGFFLRTRHKDAPIVDPAFQGICKFYDKEIGCTLTFEERPLGGRLVVPKPNRQCDYGEWEDKIWDYRGSSKQIAALHWLPFKDILGKIYDKYYDIDYTSPHASPYTSMINQILKDHDPTVFGNIFR